MKLRWENNFAGLVLQASVPRNAAYAVVDLGMLGYSDGFGARYAAPHRRNARGEWVSLGEFCSLVAAQRRCEEHFFGNSYTPLAAARLIGAGEF